MDLAYLWTKGLQDEYKAICKAVSMKEKRPLFLYNLSKTGIANGIL